MVCSKGDFVTSGHKCVLSAAQLVAQALRVVGLIDMVVYSLSCLSFNSVNTSLFLRYVQS